MRTGLQKVSYRRFVSGLRKQQQQQQQKTQNIFTVDRPDYIQHMHFRTHGFTAQL